MSTEQVTAGAAIIIDIEDRSGNKTGDGPIATAFDLSFDNPIDSPGTFRFSMPASDPKAGDLSLKLSVVRIYIDNELTFVGVVERLRRTVGGDGILLLEVSGRDRMMELAEETTGDLDVLSGDVGINTAPSFILNVMSPQWSLDTTNGDSNTGSRLFYGRFDFASKLYALSKVAEHLGQHFLYRPQLSGDDQKIIWKQSLATASGIRAIQGAGEMVQAEGKDELCFITRLERVEDGFDIVNRIIPYGAGTGKTRLTLAASTYNGDVGTPTAYNVLRANNFVDRKYTGYAYPTTGTVFYRALEFKEIAPVSNTDNDLQSAANMLAEASFRYLDRYADKHEFFRLDVLKLDYDGILPGETIRVIYYEADTDGTVIEDIDTNLIVLNIQTSVDRDGSRRYSLLVSTVDRFPDQDSKTLASEIEQGKVFSTLPQLNGNTYTFLQRLYVGANQTTEKADAFLWFGDEVVQIQQVLMRVIKNRLFSTSATVGSEVINLTATDSETINLDTTGSESAHTHTVPDHSHGIGQNQGSGGRNVGIFTGGGYYYEGTDVGLLTVTTTTNPGAVTSLGGASHSHGITMPGHTHPITMPSHDHDSTFGLNLADTKDTWFFIDLEYQINGGSWVDLNSGTTGSAANIKVFDITADVYNSTTFRPTLEDNTITFRHRHKDITSISGDGATVTVTVPSGELGVLTAGVAGDHQVTIAGTTYHNGTYTLTSVTEVSNQFTFASAVTNTETSITDGVRVLAKTAMLDCFLSVRNIIQSVAYL